MLWFILFDIQYVATVASCANAGFAIGYLMECYIKVQKKLKVIYFNLNSSWFFLIKIHKLTIKYQCKPIGGKQRYNCVCVFFFTLHLNGYPWSTSSRSRYIHLFIYTYINLIKSRIKNKDWSLFVSPTYHPDIFLVTWTSGRMNSK